MLNVSNPPKTGVLDVVAGLRDLADAVERGDFGEVHNLSWCMDGSTISYGLLGTASSPDATFVMLVEAGKQSLITEFLDK